MNRTKKNKEQESSDLVQLNNKYLRALADYQNLQKRTQAQIEEGIRSEKYRLMRGLLPIVDDLERAAGLEKTDGIVLILKRFLDVLKSEGVMRIETAGKDFDPHSMECIEVVEGGQEGKVFEELQAGYVEGDRIVRAARVRVGNGAVK